MVSLYLFLFHRITFVNMNKKYNSYTENQEQNIHRSNSYFIYAYWIMILKDFKRLFCYEKVLWYSIKTLSNLKKVLWYLIKTLCHLKKVLWYSIKSLHHLKKVS